MGDESRLGRDYRLLSAIVPVYNERNTVGEVVRRMRKVDLPIDVEIVVVDDASTDGTDKILETIQDSTVHVLRHDHNQGKTACIRTGLAAARGDVVVIQDADLEYDPDNWPRLLAPILGGRARVVYGSRFIGERETMRYSRWVSNRLQSLVADVLYNTNVSDVATAQKAFDRAVLDGITIESQRFGFETEILAKLLRRGERIYEVPISYAGREEGRKFTGRDRLQAIASLVRYRFGERR